MKYMAGWEIHVKKYNSLDEVYHGYPELFYTATIELDGGEFNILPPDQQPPPDERKMVDQVNEINTEGNYHEFIFRPCFQYEE